MSNMLCYLKNSKEESRIFLHSGFLADDFQPQTFQEDDDHSNQILFFLNNQAGKIAQKHVVHRFLFVNCQTESTPKQQKTLFRWLFSWYLEGVLSCHFFGLPSKFYHLFYKKPSPSIPTSRESPVIAVLAPVQHGFGTLRAYHHRKKLQQADELIKARRWGTMGKP